MNVKTETLEDGLNGIIQKLQDAEGFGGGIHIAFKTEGQYFIAMPPKTAMVLCATLAMVTRATDAPEDLIDGSRRFLLAFGTSLAKTVNRYERTSYPEEMPEEAEPEAEPQAEEKAEGTE